MSNIIMICKYIIHSIAWVEHSRLHSLYMSLLTPHECSQCLKMYLCVTNMGNLINFVVQVNTNTQTLRRCCALLLYSGHEGTLPANNSWSHDPMTGWRPPIIGWLRREALSVLIPLCGLAALLRRSHAAALDQRHLTGSLWLHLTWVNKTVTN